MALDTYTNLKTSIGDWLIRSGLGDQIDEFIDLNEATLRRHKWLKRQRTGQLAVTTAVTTFPASWNVRSLVSIYYNGTNRFGPLKIVSPERLADEKASLGDTGTPQYGALLNNGTQLLVGPAPNDTFTFDVMWNEKLTALSTDNETNWILEDHPDLYLYGSLLHAAPYLKDDPRIATWQHLYDRALGEVKDLIEEQQWEANSPTRRIRSPIG